MARRKSSSDGTSVVDVDSADRSRGSARWYRSKIGDPNVHLLAAGHAKALQQTLSGRFSKNRARERIYEGHDLNNNRLAIAGLEAAGITIARLNATKSIIDTFVSRLTKDRPMPSFDTTGADWEMKRRSKKWRSFIVSKMLETEYDDLSRDQVLDGSILGNGFIRVDDNEDDVFAERIPVNEMLFDDRECRYGKPQQAMRVYRVARDLLTELYPKHADLIRNAPASESRPDDKDTDIFGDLEDYVDAYEGWHLPSTKDNDDGRHILILDNTTLIHEKWIEPRFPWSHLRIFKPRSGLLGTGFVDQLASLQHRVNCIVRDLQLNLAATGRGFFAVNEANDIPTEMLTGWQPFKLKYKGGTPPVWTAPQAFNQAQLNALDYFIQQMYDLTGVSKANAESKSALGAGASGIALDTQYDIDSDRFRMPQANYARARLDGAQCFIDASARVARRRAQSKGEKRSFTAVSYKSRDAIERLEYDKVVLAEGTYKMKIEPVNFLPDTRAGKLAVVEQLAKAGIIAQWMVPMLFDEPDLAHANSMLLAPIRNALRKMDDLYDVEMEMPLPGAYNDLDLELKVATAYVNLVEEERAPDEIQDRFRQYADFVVDALKKKQIQQGATAPGTVAPGAPPPMAPAQGPLPGGVPAMPTEPVPQPAMIGAVS